MKKIVLFVLILLSFKVFSQANDVILQPQQMKEDIEVLKSAFLNLHPGLYKFNSPEEIEHLFQELEQETTVSLSEKAFFLLLSKFTEKIKCGHTYLNIYNQKKQIKQRIYSEMLLPFFFVVLEGKIIITHNLSDNSSINRGDEITEINGYKSKQIIDSLLTVSRSDGRNSLGKKLNNINITPDEAKELTLFDIYFPLFFNTDNEYQVGVNHFGKNNTRYYNVNPVNNNTRITKYEERFGKVPVYEDTWYYKILSGNTAYMKFGTFAFWNSKFDTKKYIDSIFNDVISNPGIKNLIIDIRGNEGGDNTREYILSYISEKEFGCKDSQKTLFKYLTIPDSLAKHLYTWDDSFKAPKDPAMYLKNEMGLYEEINQEPCQKIKPQKNTFKGKSFLLIDAKNSSAGFQMAELFKNEEFGITIGETTGGSQMGINGGYFFFLYLPNSSFEIDLPLKYQYKPGKPDSGIKPDIEVFTTQRDIKYNTDPQLEAALKLIGN